MELKQQLLTQVRLELRPLLIQAVRLLPLNQLEIRQKLMQEYLNNPAIELKELEDVPSVEGMIQPVKENWDGDDDSWFDRVLEEPFYEWQPGSSEQHGDAHEFDWFWEKWASNPITLAEHLRLQAYGIEDDAVRSIVLFLIEFLNTKGYIEESDEELAEFAGVTLHEIQVARETLKRMDPPGVGSRDIRECLLVQLEILGLEDSPAYYLLSEKWDVLQKNDREALIESMRGDRETVESALEVLRQLDPFPGNRFQSHEILYIYPDVIVKEQNGKYVVEVCRDLVPRFGISKRYLNLLKRKDIPEEDKKFIKQRVASAKNLLKTLRYCDSTLKRTAEFIVRHQESFFREGLPGLKPLTLHDVAQAIGLHESTISRTVKHKYMQTPRGTFEMRYFFQRRLHVQGKREGLSSIQVKLKIQEIIAHEPREKPYTDEMIVKLLAAQGIRLSRRAVTKYRRELHIPNTRQRIRNYKKSS